MTLPHWDENYPDRAILASEVEDMVHAFAEILLQEVPRRDIRGIYLKGSAQKEWESPLDYVPELSDVDIHLLLAEGSPAENQLRAPELALEIQRKIEKQYFLKNPEPLHVPRPQVLLLNQLQGEEDYVPSPRCTVRVVFGEDYPLGDYSDEHSIRTMDCKRLESEQEYLLELGLNVIDKPFRYIWTAVRMINWHISPSGPRILSLLGVPPEDAWSMNRSKIVKVMEEKKETAVAHDYANYYLHGWEYFLSDFENWGAARSAMSSGISMLRRGVEIAKSWHMSHSGERGDLV